MTRTEIETIVRNPETGEEKTLYGNEYKPVKCHREGFTEVVKQTMVKFQMMTRSSENLQRKWRIKECLKLQSKNQARS